MSLAEYSPAPFSIHFQDVPWGQVPGSRLGKISELLSRRRGGLLGGSGNPTGKVSKLQALAAQRRREQEEKKRKEANVPSEDSNDRSHEHSSVAILDKLDNLPDNHTPQVNATQPQGDVPDRKDHATNRYKRQKVVDNMNSLTSPQPAQETLQLDDTAPTEEELYQIRAGPSEFANALLGTFRSSDPLDCQPHDFAISIAPNDANLDPFAGPSPDDVVLKAQSKSKQQSSKKATIDKKAEKNGVVEGVATMKLDEAPKVKSKNIDVPAEFEKTNLRSSANFVVIGHVDHGKSTLMGRLLYDLKHPNMSQRDFNKLQKASSEAGKSSFALAWAMDSTEEERSRGVTIDIATNHFSTDKTDFTILDAPGHRDFIPNMIGGTSQADFAVLVVDASGDAFEAGLKGQTREHALLARSIGISRVTVAVNKMDAAKWNKERFDEIVAQLSGFFSAAGFLEKNVVFVPCAGLSGENVVMSLTAEERKVASWYNGPTLLAALESSEPARRRLREPLRLTISDVFRNAVPGVPTGDISIVGKLDAGNLQVGTVILAQPMGEAGTIKGIELAGEHRDWAVAGQIVTLHLVGIEQDHLRSGDVICEKGNKEVQNVASFTAKCLAFEHLLPGPVDCHRGRMQSAARVSEFVEIVSREEASEKQNSNGVKKKKPRVVKPQQVVRLRVVLENNDKGLPLEPPDRIVLRQEGKTVAAGLID